MIQRYNLYDLDVLFEGGIFGEIILPPEINKEELTSYIFQNYGELGYCKYIETAPADIARWFRMKRKIFDKMIKSVNAEYNPIENYDRFEEISDTKTGESTTTSTSGGDSVLTAKVAGMNSATLKTDTESKNVSNATAGATGDSKETTTHKSHVHGNIGVTTADQMLKGFRETIQYDVIENISKMFAHEFLVLIYI